MEEKLLQTVRDLLRETPLIDGHNDTPWRYRREHENNLEALDFSGDTSPLNPIMKTDIPRMRQGCMGGQFWSVFVPDAWAGEGVAKKVGEQIDLVHRLVEKFPADLEMARTAANVERIHASGRIASLIGLEGGHSIENSLDILREFFKRGARYMTLGCAKSNDLADSCTGKRLHGGLSPLGKEAVKEMNRLGMMVDLSHASDETMRDAIASSEAPVIFSHSSTRALCNSPRNVPDDILRIMAEKGGVIMICFVTMFLNEETRGHYEVFRGIWKERKARYPEDEDKVKKEIQAWEKDHPWPPTLLSEVADHIDHARDVAGIDSIGIGSDFGGFRITPIGLEDVSKYPDLFTELLRRGYSPDDIKKIAGENILRVMREVERLAE